MSDTRGLALLRIVRAIHDVVVGCRDGVPAGTAYATLMSHGCTIAQYEQIEGMMIRAGAITRRGDLLFSTVPKEETT